MIKSTLGVMDELKEYASPKARLTRLLKSGALTQIRRGLYVDDVAVSPRALAPVIYGPSYISFQFALASSGLIPENVPVITSASYNKDKDKVFRTPLGEYRYYYLPPAVYPYGIRMEEELGLNWFMASPEKALCDVVYKIPSVITVPEIETLLLDDLRIDRNDLVNLDRLFIAWIAPLYRRKSILALARWFEKEGLHG